jgi:M6 family metalloprotease-like protein
MSYMNKFAHGILVLVPIIAAILGVVDSVPVLAADQAALNGWLTVRWADESRGASYGPFYQITETNGNVTPLIIEEGASHLPGGVLALNGKYVGVQGALASMSALGVQGGAKATPFVVTSIFPVQSPLSQMLQADVQPMVSGSRPWVSIMCKFSDYTVEPKNLAYFQGMYTNVKPGMDHYWREISYDTANVAGSSAAGWFVLPHTEAYYNPSDTQGGTDLDLLRADCIAAADASVNFSLYSGINMMFNSNFDNGYAWGGSDYLTLDGVSKVWSITWEPPWGYDDITVIAHEMGHGFGLPHSSGSYGQTYDNQWDVMSDTWSNCSRSEDLTYGCLGQQTITYHKDMLGWIPAGKKYLVGQNSQTNLTMEQLALPATGNYLMVQIPIAGSSSHFYTVEVRRQTGYDYKLPGQAVIIHEVDTSRSRPAYVIDADGNGNTGDVGARWEVGEVFSDVVNKIYVKVLSATATGFSLNIRVGDLVRADVDLSGAVDLKDVIVLLQIVSGLTPVGTTSLNADVDEDGKLGLAEAIFALQELASS